jgi:hypothetical protein
VCSRNSESTDYVFAFVYEPNTIDSLEYRHVGICTSIYPIGVTNHNDLKVSMHSRSDNKESIDNMKVYEVAVNDHLLQVIFVGSQRFCQMSNDIVKVQPPDLVLILSPSSCWVFRLGFWRGFCSQWLYSC